jgi:nicotinamidase-related amidase
MPTALVIVDVQQGMFTYRPALYRGEEVLRRIGSLLDRARAGSVPVFHVQHDGGLGHVLAKGSAGWPHHPVVAPQAGETIIEKRHSSAFHDTEFHALMKALRIDRLVIAGMQTEMCVDSACRTAAALGYRVVLAADAHTTFDSPVLPAELIIAHHNYALASGIADVSVAREIQF